MAWTSRATDPSSAPRERDPGRVSATLNWKRVNCLGMGLTAALTGATLFVLAGNGHGGLDEFRMINTLLLVAFSFVALTAVFSALGSKFLGLTSRCTCMLAVGLAWMFSVPLAAWINMGGATAEAFEIDLGDWAWALLPALLYAISIGITALARDKSPA
ncbi:hypothetical protein [Paeniglutamicibacter sp.]|uniref:hypothetical protein n=1 Tax=Paeniglutamicibacter sp. TaxID=1934391 RepID=UPI00398968EF